MASNNLFWESYVVLIGKDLNEDELKTDFQHHFPAW